MNTCWLTYLTNHTLQSSRQTLQVSGDFDWLTYWQVDQMTDYVLTEYKYWLWLNDYWLNKWFNNEQTNDRLIIQMTDWLFIILPNER